MYKIGEYITYQGGRGHSNCLHTPLMKDTGMESFFLYLLVNFTVFECSAIMLNKDVKIHFISLVRRDKISSYLRYFVQ